MHVDLIFLYISLSIYKYIHDCFSIELHKKCYFLLVLQLFNSLRKRSSFSRIILAISDFVGFSLTCIFFCWLFTGIFDIKHNCIAGFDKLLLQYLYLSISLSLSLSLFLYTYIYRYLHKTSNSIFYMV